MDPLDGAFDVHLHLSRWWPDLPRTGYRGDLDYTASGLLREMDGAGVGAGLLLPVYEGPSPAESLEEALAHARASAGRLRPVATVAPGPAQGSVEATVRSWASAPEIAAIKLFPGYHPFYPHDPALGPVWEYAARRRIPVMLHQGDTLARHGLLKYARPIEVDEVAVRYRDVRFVLCHLGNPWVEEAAELVYKNENVYADTSGLLPHPGAPYFARSFARVQEVLRGVVDTIGSAERLLYGSDWPLESLANATALIDGLELEDDDRAAVLGGTARRLYGPGRA